MRRSIARGRVFPQSFSTDRRYGRLSLKTIALFPLMWANGDDQGRLSGDPEEIKYAVCPNIDHITKKDIPELLKELQDNRLILCYDTPKSVVIQMLDWWEIHRPQWAWPSEYQPPEGWQDHLRYKKDAHTVETLNWPVSGESETGTGKSIYFILDEAANAIKIGISDSPKMRLKDLQASNPHPLKLIKVLENSNLREERELHQRFAKSAINSEWFSYSEEIQAFVSGENTGEDSGENTGEDSGEKSKILPLTTLPPEKETETEKETERGRGRGKGNSPERSGEETSPSLIRLSILEKNTYDLILNCFRNSWARVPAGRPWQKIPREPKPRELAQLRDLSKQISAAGGCSSSYISDAFNEAASHGKMTISYVRAIILDWMGVARDRSP